MPFTYTRASKLTFRQTNVCTGGILTYSTKDVSGVEVFKLPLERRKKPSPLDITPRAKQWTAQVTCRICRWRGQDTVAWCQSRYFQVINEYWDYEIPTTLAGQIGLVVFPQKWVLALRQKIQEDKVSFAETLGEWREAINLLESGVKTFQRAGRLAASLMKRRGKKRALKRWFRAQFGSSPRSELVLQDAVQLDLALKFGIKPNLGLLWDTLEALGRVRSRKRKIKITIKTKVEAYNKGLGGGVLTVYGERGDRVVAFVTYDVGHSDFTAGNLASALWAGTSASFIVDWFYDVGSYLESFDALKGVLSFKAAHMIRDKFRMVDTRLLGRGQNEVCEVPGLHSYRSFERQIINKLPYADAPQPMLPETDLWGRLHTLIEILAVQRRVPRNEISDVAT